MIPQTHGPTSEQLRGRTWGELGVRGVYYQANGRFQARIRIRGKLWNLGTFDTIAEAKAAHAEAEERLA